MGLSVYAMDQTTRGCYGNYSMEPVFRTSDNLRGLIAELDSKLGPQRTAPKFTPTGERIIDLRDGAPEPEPDRSSARLTWGRIALVLALLVGISYVVAQPWQNDCDYSSDICKIAELDIDALRVALPNSDLIATLPNIDALDPDDVLTVGEIFEMERFAELNLEELLTQVEVNQLLETLN